MFRLIPMGVNAETMNEPICKHDLKIASKSTNKLSVIHKSVLVLENQNLCKMIRLYSICRLFHICSQHLDTTVSQIRICTNALLTKQTQSNLYFQTIVSIQPSKFCEKLSIQVSTLYTDRFPLV